MDSDASYTICLPHLWEKCHWSLRRENTIRSAPADLELWLPVLIVLLDATRGCVYIMFLDVHDSLYIYQRTCCIVGWKDIVEKRTSRMFKHKSGCSVCCLCVICHFMALHGQGTRSDRMFKELTNSHWWAWTNYMFDSSAIETAKTRQLRLQKNIQLQMSGVCNATKCTHGHDMSFGFCCSASTLICFRDLRFYLCSASPCDIKFVSMQFDSHSRSFDSCEYCAGQDIAWGCIL